MKKSGIIDEIKDRIGILEKWRGEGKKKTTEKKASKVDENNCPSCGSDLLFVEEGIVYCSSCKEYYEYEGEEEE